MSKILPAILSALARLPADRASVDLGALVVLILTAVGSALALSYGWVTPEQLPSALDMAWAVVLTVLPLVGVRGAALAAKASEARQRAEALPPEPRG